MFANSGGLGAGLPLGAVGAVSNSPPTEDDRSDAIGPASVQPGRSSAPLPSPARSRTRFYVAAVVVIVAVAIALAYVLSGGFTHPSGSSVEVLVPSGTAYAIPGGQFNGITLVLTAPAIVNATLINTFGLVLYTMNTTQYQSFVKTDILAGYQWTSGTIANETVYNLNLSLPAGSWVLAFVDPSQVNPTNVGFYSDLTLTRS